MYRMSLELHAITFLSQLMGRFNCLYVIYLKKKAKWNGYAAASMICSFGNCIQIIWTECNSNATVHAWNIPKSGKVHAYMYCQRNCLMRIFCYILSLCAICIEVRSLQLTCSELFRRCFYVFGFSLLRFVLLFYAIALNCIGKWLLFECDYHHTSMQRVIGDSGCNY